MCCSRSCSTCTAVSRLAATLFSANPKIASRRPADGTSLRRWLPRRLLRAIFPVSGRSSATPERRTAPLPSAVLHCRACCRDQNQLPETHATPAPLSAGISTQTERHRELVRSREDSLVGLRVCRFPRGEGRKGTRPNGRTLE